MTRYAMLVLLAMVPGNKREATLEEHTMNTKNVVKVAVFFLFLLLLGCGNTLAGFQRDVRDKLIPSQEQKNYASPAEQGQYDAVFTARQQDQFSVAAKVMKSRNITLKNKVKMVVEMDCDPIMHEAFVQNNKPSQKNLRALYQECPQLEKVVVAPTTTPLSPR